ncbi:MAG TPA: hypothetical protein DCQ99_03590 [Nitrospinae bacterium]|nr:hypothetical protein [Nitrospinota bacterium]HBA27310.1 hypothetical protein [Nitrospinota bacterium]
MTSMAQKNMSSIETYQEDKKPLHISIDTLSQRPVCKLLNCRREFIPKRIDQVFCCTEHRLLYHSTIREIGKKAMEIMK